MPTIRKVAKGDSKPGSLDCESGVLPLSYRSINNNNNQYVIIKNTIDTLLIC